MLPIRIDIAYAYLVLLLLIVTSASAQLEVVGLTENSAIRKLLLNHPQLLDKSKSTDTLQLPFFDDFSSVNIYPDSALWENKDVFINNSYAYISPNFNVATFDALGSDGLLNPGASTNSFIADYLTSLPLDLSGLTPGDSVYLSFYYQPGGIAGDDPDEEDSLVLEFSVPDTSWFYAWSSQGSASHDFKQIMIPVKNPVFFKKGFKFRFYNYATLGDPLKPSWQSNCDYWHLDFIRLDSARSVNDTIVDDVGMLFLNSGKSSFISGYESVPWSHYKTSSIPWKANINSTSKNLFTSQRLIDMNYMLIDVYNSDTLLNESIGSENNLPLDTLMLFEPFPGNPFPSNSSDSALFEIKTYINNTNNISPLYYPNDTMSYFQKFYNYYAYDDGTPEAGIGVYGNNSQNGRFCVRYRTYQPDTLIALQIFFNHTNESNDKYFHLTVWANDEGKPGDTLYQKIGEMAVYNGLNQFNNYLLDRTIIVSDTFYIGWQKVNTIEMMNVGFDLNRNAEDNVFYSLTEDGTWYASSVPGAPMIRPVFRKNYLINVPWNESEKAEIKAFPNPSNDYINIEVAESLSPDAEMKIFNCSGSLIYRCIYKDILDIKSFDAGVYYLVISDQQKVFRTKKLVIIP